MKYLKGVVGQAPSSKSGYRIKRINKVGKNNLFSS
jgi:hypothetical protein